MNLVWQIAIGASLIALGLLLLAQPKIVDWISEQTNLRAARQAAERGDYRGLADYPGLLRNLHWFVPGFFLVMGLLVILDAVFG